MRAQGAVRNGERGFTLVEMMITIAVASILMVVVARLFLGTYKGWVFNYSALIAQQKSRIYRDAINKNLRQASAATVQIGRYNGNVPPRSMISFTDADGRNWVFYQHDSGMSMGSWTLNGFGARVPVASTVNEVMPHNSGKVKRLVFYYPDIKDPRKVGFSLDLEWTLLRDNSLKPVTIQMVGKVDIRDP